MSFLCATQESNEKSHEGLANRVKGFSVLADFFSEKAQPGLLVLSEAQYANIKISIPANNKNILIQFDEDTPPDKLAHLAQQAWDQKQLVIYVKKSTLIQNNIENFIHYFRKTVGILFLDEVMYEQLMGQNSRIFEGIMI